MREEDVTKALLQWLIDNNWDIVCFDFPQSGTGRLLQPNDTTSEKNKGAINPDIVAARGTICLFFENKNHFYYPDFEKQFTLKTQNGYSNAISALLAQYPVEEIYYGIGLPTKKYNKSAKANANMVDFVLGVNDDLTVETLSCNGSF